MRPIHRPIHELAILPEIWDKMTTDEQEAARAQGKIRLPVREKFLCSKIDFNVFYPIRRKQNL
jgi:hypothetical protein